MQNQNRLLEDIARLANGAAGVAAGLKDEIEAVVRARLDRLLADMDLVTRDEFETVRAMAAKARSEQEATAKRVAALEAELAAGSTTAKRASASKKTSAARTGAKGTDGKTG